MIREYLWYRRFAFLAWSIAAAMMGGTALLAGLALIEAAYGVLLAAFVLLGFCLYDYGHFRRRLTALREICGNLSDTLHALPEPPDALCAQYNELTEALYALMRRERDEQNSGHSAQIEYYTMWLHQIKTPIAAMRLAIDADDGGQSAVLSAELFKIERYVDMALQYAKLGNLGSDMVISRCALDTLLASCVRKYSTLFIYKRLSVKIEKTGITVATDEKWLAFVIEQVLSNAVKYTNTGGVRIYARGALLCIEDTGIGIRAEDIDRIFDKGYTGYNGRFDRRASGLGLFMSRSIAEKLHITLSAQHGRAEGALLFIDLENVICDGDIT